MDHPSLARKPDLVLIKMKKRPCLQVDFVVSADYWVKRKNRKWKDRQLSGSCQRAEKMIPIVIGALEMAHILKTWEDLLSCRLQWKTTC